MALGKQRKLLIIHSGVGAQYTSAEFNINCQIMAGVNQAFVWFDGLLSGFLSYIYYD